MGSSGDYLCSASEWLDGVPQIHVSRLNSIGVEDLSVTLILE